MNRCDKVSLQGESIMRKFLWASLALVGVVAGAGALWEPLAATGYEAPKGTYDVEIVRDEFGVLMALLTPMPKMIFRP